jgi:hypothetical protein
VQEAADEKGERIFALLSKLSDWLEARTDLFPRSFGENFAARCLNKQVRSAISKVCLGSSP